MSHVSCNIIPPTPLPCRLTMSLFFSCKSVIFIKHTKQIFGFSHTNLVFMMNASLTVGYFFSIIYVSVAGSGLYIIMPCSLMSSFNIFEH